MSATKSCTVDAFIVTLDLDKKQRLRHTIIDDTGVVFVLSDDCGNRLLESQKPPRTRDWPANKDEVPTSNKDIHTLGIEFADTRKLRWHVQLMTSEGVLIQEVKDCTFNNVGNVDDYHDSIQITITGQF